MLAFQNSGATVEFEDYIAALYDYDDNADGQADRFGFLALVDDIQWVFDNWIDGFDNPTRIVVVAHSHGCVWAHIATSVLPQVPIDYLISLDGNCFTWQRSYGPEVFDYLAANGNPYTWDISDPCDVWPVSGLVNLADTEDVVFSNVLVNIEVRSADFLVFDAQINYRLDGTRLEIYTYDAMFDNHSGVYDPSGESMLWVLSQLAALGH